MTKHFSIGKHIRFFLGDYLPQQRNASPNTIQAYRDALKQLLCFVAPVRKRPVAELALFDIDRKIVLSFLKSIEIKNANSISTRNHRLAAVRSFFRCVAQTTPEAIEHCNQILSIPFKKSESKTIEYLTTDEVKAIFNQIPLSTFAGQRDDVLLRFLHNTGARVQEAVDVMANDLRLDTPPSVRLCGKGRKERLCPLWPDTAERVRSFLIRRNVELDSTVPVFINRNGKALTRFGVRYILGKYVCKAVKLCPTLERKNVHPHTLRHSNAMHLLQSGNDINTIRCWLGHSDVTTTNIYAEIDLEMKQRALNSMPPIPGSNDHAVIKDDTLLSWLESL